MNRRIACCVALVAGVAVAGCGSQTSTRSAPDAVTQQETVTVRETVPLSAAAPPVQPAPIETTTSTFVAAPAEPAVMPNVTCLNLQAAQDTIQAEGVFFSRSADATGRGRHQIVDSNWVVVSQKPAAGEPVAEAQAVLSVVKLGEPGDCS